MKKTKILFVCKYNRFRSVIAEGIFNKLNKNKLLVAKSAGAIKGNPIGENVKKLANSFQINVKSKPSGLSSKLMVWQNLTIIVADDVPPALFNKNKKYEKRVIIWKIPDVQDDKIKSMKKISHLIKIKIEKLLLDLKSEDL
ncbi:hypothetical protein COU53_02875 [Candidatus Pacearchaeota archaeon CG10_big_fil_rev_8_21_14_0_10_30_48]|nr:MAG: hypothetical protein COU53_02875 [Candidatus Pacearchaeota archaeon CG10_big_fil_rev_8_21_14_0_10_30_48]